MTEIDTAKLERQKRREEFRLDNLKTRLDELTRDEIFTLEQYILVNYRRCSQKHTAYGLKQRLTSETGIYIYQMDMYNLMKGLGFKGYLNDEGSGFLCAKRKRLPKRP